MPHITQEERNMEIIRTANDLKKFCEDSDISLGYTDTPFGHLAIYVQERIDSKIDEASARTAEEQERKYEEIFKWLMGEKGDFPDLSKKPHYSFRKELRKKLSAITPSK